MMKRRTFGCSLRGLWIFVCLVISGQTLAGDSPRGQVVGWGKMVLPLAETGIAFARISAGFEFNLGLRRDGTVVGWGNGQIGDANPPAGLSNVVALAAGRLFALAVRGNGTVVQWGIPFGEIPMT